MNLRGAAAVTATCAAATLLVPGTAARCARLLDPPPTATPESAVLDLLAVLGTGLLGHLAVVSVLVLVLVRVAPRSRALALALRMTPSRWRRLVLVTAGAAVVLTAQAPSVGRPAGEPVDVRPPPLGGLLLPDRPESPEAAVPVRRAAGTRPVVVVRAGDSLWRIAERALPPTASTADVARSVRRWYGANRSAVGPDPDLVHPGTRLVRPQQETRP